MLWVPMRPTYLFFLLTALLGILSSAAGADAVSGTIRFDGKAYPLNQAIAIRVPSAFLGNALVTKMAFSDAPITAEQLQSNMGILELMKAGPIHGVSLEFSDDRSYFSMSTIDSGKNTNASVSGTMEQIQLKVHTPQAVSGTYKMPERSLGGMRLAIDIQFDVKVAAAVVAQLGAVKKGAEAQTLASVKAYLGIRKAVQMEDLAGIRKFARFPQDFEGADGLKFVKLMKSEEPTGIVVVAAAEGADKASLTITGTKDGKRITKTFEMQLKDGRWTTNNDNWEGN
jgi:hypothetical protein